MAILSHLDNVQASAAAATTIGFVAATAAIGSVVNPMGLAALAPIGGAIIVSMVFAALRSPQLANTVNGGE
eukprot:CAMPEP_0179352394 /NCGR_PEP_ID=MMETSP0797-20121207/75781_1 /TAXON_ID=47934 /ORGANISM="Dinophysis acuminata, Strain DAEP01" /LENGTH=70 /DNA_ID=CAMNT_0021067401 /DNA_START=84 /DNA_END=296 /DNA_ORIENTATION=+